VIDHAPAAGVRIVGLDDIMRPGREDEGFRAGRRSLPPRRTCRVCSSSGSSRTAGAHQDEVVQDAELIGFHHGHLRVADPTGGAQLV